MAERKGQQCLLLSERISWGCDGLSGASEEDAGAHFTCRLADGKWSGFVDYPQIYSASRGNGPFSL